MIADLAPVPPHLRAVILRAIAERKLEVIENSPLVAAFLNRP